VAAPRRRDRRRDAHHGRRPAGRVPAARRPPRAGGELVTRVAAWLAALAPRERVLVSAAAVLTVVIGAGGAAPAGRADRSARRAGVAGHERELAEVRRLAAVLRQAPATTATDGAPLLTRLEAAAMETVGRERIAGMTPTTSATSDGAQEERVALRVSGASL